MYNNGYPGNSYTSSNYVNPFYNYYSNPLNNTSNYYLESDRSNCGTPQKSKDKFNLGFIPADTFLELAALSQTAPIINTPERLDNFLERNIFNLDPATITAFRNSVVMKEKGVGGFDYRIIANKLTYTQFEYFLAHFGYSMIFFTDRNHKVCTADPGFPLECRAADTFCVEYCPDIIGGRVVMLNGKIIQ
ncbi:hypothetical protein CON66_00240 [Bacillus cereus]|uniref:hypothetical protein n=1 Tax=Bacillus cereus TaxID=1396 RepID=UPI000BEE0273|nr:hypothetical protein [Bacillus cereus]PEA97956.1 hypothetical protein CON66_00240 [Bacillus cereus]